MTCTCAGHNAFKGSRRLQRLLRTASGFRQRSGETSAKSHATLDGPCPGLERECLKHCPHESQLRRAAPALAARKACHMCAAGLPVAAEQPRHAALRAVKKKVPSTGEIWDNSHYIPHHRSTASEWLPSSRPAVPPHIKIADNRDFHANNGGQFGYYQLLPDI